jgi:putative phage-type endonuclease
MIEIEINGDAPEAIDELLILALESPQQSEDEWRAERRQGLGGSDAPVVLGLSPWKQPFTLWGEKIGRLEEPVLDSDAVEMGKILEPAILRRYQQKTGRTARAWPGTLIVQNSGVDWLRATPDGLTYDDDKGVGLVQLKSTGEYWRGEWDEGPPLHIQAQVQHEMAATCATWASIVVLIGGRTLKWFDVERHEAFIASMLDQEAAFWQMVVHQRQPAISNEEAMSGGKSLGRALAKLYGADDGDSIALPDEAMELDQRLREIKRQAKQLDEEQAAIENRIKDMIGQNSIGVLPNGRGYSWKQSTRAGYTVEPTTIRTLKAIGK